MSGSIISPIVGDVVVLTTVCIVYSLLSFLFLAPALAGSPALSSQGLFKAVVPGMHGIHSPD